MKRLNVSMVLSPLALLALCATPPAHAVGHRLDVNVVDRDTGNHLKVYQHENQWWVAGQPGGRYAIELRNPSGARVLGVISVDGVNVLSGDTAHWEQAGYVLPARETTEITGWRKSDSEVAAFHFTALPESYAAQTGRPDDVGVIGVAVFKERKRRPPVIVHERAQADMSAGSRPAAPSPQAAERTPATTAEASASVTPESSSRNADAKPAPATPQLGTGHGAREISRVRNTRFVRSSSTPTEVITIRYDSYENLVARGIVAAAGTGSDNPRAFPGTQGYVPDPPSRN